MDIVISHTAALHLIRQMPGPASLPVADSARLPQRMPSICELQEARALCPALDEVEGPIGVLLVTKTAERECSHAVGHVWSSRLPRRAFLQVEQGIRCPSPLFLPVLLASRLNELEMVLLLAELMGLYSLTPHREIGLIQRDAPLITPDELRSFLDDIGPVWGSAKVRRALDRAPVLAASPLEAKLYLRMTLPFAKGGYHLGKVVLNDEVSLSRVSRRIKTLSKRKPDLLFVGAEKHGVCLDYMGAWHDDAAQVRKDTHRRNELLANGFTPYEIYKVHYDDLDYMDSLADSIRADLGMSEVTVDRERRARRRRARFYLWRDLEAIDALVWEMRPDLR